MVGWDCDTLVVRPRAINGNTESALVVLGEIANFAAYAFAPAILVTPLGALSVLIGYNFLRQNDYIPV